MTTQLNRVLAGIVADLEILSARYALVGGLAVSARALPRTTRDVDLAVIAADDAAAKGLVFGLTQRGYEVDAMLEQKKLGRLATVRLRSPHTKLKGPVVDLLFCSSSIETETVEAAELIEVLPDLRLPVAAIPHLMAMKALAQDDRKRPHDHDDLRALLEESSPADIDHTRQLLRLIEARDAARGRALAAAFEAMLDR